jgi:hypothetical protein
MPIGCAEHPAPGVVGRDSGWPSAIQRHETGQRFGQGLLDCNTDLAMRLNRDRRVERRLGKSVQCQSDLPVEGAAGAPELKERTINRVRTFLKGTNLRQRLAEVPGPTAVYPKGLFRGIAKTWPF